MNGQGKIGGYMLEIQRRGLFYCRVKPRGKEAAVKDVTAEMFAPITVTGFSPAWEPPMRKLWNSGSLGSQIGVLR